MMGMGGLACATGVRRRVCRELRDTRGVLPTAWVIYALYTARGGARVDKLALFRLHRAGCNRILALAST